MRQLVCRSSAAAAALSTLLVMGLAGHARAVSARLMPGSSGLEADALDGGADAKHARCGVVMVAIGQKYSSIAAKVADHTRKLEAPAGWCPLDPKLDHIPVTLFTDASKESLRRETSRGLKLVSIRNISGAAAQLMAHRGAEGEGGWPWGWGGAVQAKPGGAALGRSSSEPSRAGSGYDLADGLEVRPESDMEPWQGEDEEALQHHLGSWKVRWYHAQSILAAPYEMVMYLDVDAFACSGEGVARLFKKVRDAQAAFGSPVVPERMKCRSSMDNCEEPRPPMPRGDVAAWQSFTERNAGVMVIDMRKGRPIVEDFAKTLKGMAGKTTGDQFAMRASLFLHRSLPQVVFGNEDVCRYKPVGTCDAEEPSRGCAVHHQCKMQSLVEFKVVPEGTYKRMGLDD